MVARCVRNRKKKLVKMFFLSSAEVDILIPIFMALLMLIGFLKTPTLSSVIVCCKNTKNRNQRNFLFK